MLLGSGTKFRRHNSFFCVRCWWDPTQNLEHSGKLDGGASTTKMEAPFLQEIFVSDVDGIRHKIWKHNGFLFFLSGVAGIGIPQSICKDLLSKHFKSAEFIFEQISTPRQLLAKNMSKSQKIWVRHGHLGPMTSGKKKITKFHEMD